MGGIFGGGGGPSVAQQLQQIATIQAIQAANQPPPPPPQLPMMPYQQSAAAMEAARNSFAAGLRGQEADILGGERKKKNRLGANAPAAEGAAQAPDAAPATDSYSNKMLG